MTDLRTKTSAELRSLLISNNSRAQRIGTHAAIAAATKIQRQITTEIKRRISELTK